MSYPYKFYSSRENLVSGLSQNIVSTNKGFFDDTRNISEICLNYKGRTVIGYEDTWSVFKFAVGGNYKKQIFVYIGKELSEALHKLDPIKVCCKSDSIRRVFASSKVLKSYLEDNRFYDEGLNIQRFLKHEWIYHTIQFDEVSDDKWLSKSDAKKYMEYLADFTDQLIYDLIHIKNFNLNNLDFKSKEEIERTVKKVPGWVNDVLKGGLRAGAALLTGGLLANISIPDFGDAIPDLDLDADLDIDTSNLIGSNFDTSSISDVDIDLDPSDNFVSNDYSAISFMGAPNDGTYTNTGQTVSVRSDSGTVYNNISVFLHHGKKYIDFKNHWFEMSGSGFFSFLGNGYKILR